MTTFTAETFQNQYLPAGATEVHAVVTVTATGESRSQTTGSAAEVLIIDISGSMGEQRKLQEAQLAAKAAIDLVPDGVLFGVVAGAHVAYQAYPARKRLAVAAAATRAEAKRAVDHLGASGGTAIGTWLEAARTAFEEAPGAVCHALLLTDGRNQHESPEDLRAVVARCEGRFQCDCRGVGTDWNVAELREIASRLLGTVDIVAQPAQLTQDFERVMRQATARRTGAVSLRVWAPTGATVSLLQQVSPTIEDLTSRAVAVDERTRDYPTGAWGEESRDYHVCIRVPGQAVGEQMLAGRISLVVDGEVGTTARVLAEWTDDLALSTRISREVAHYTGQVELAQVIQDGLEARRAGDTATATSKLGRAVALAAASGNDATLELLAGVVDIEDAPSGTVRLKRAVSVEDEMTLDTRSTKTSRVERSTG